LKNTINGKEGESSNDGVSPSFSVVYI